MLTLTDLGLGVLLPAVITFAVLAIAGQWWRGREAKGDPGVPDWAWPLALGVGYLVAHFAMVVVPNVLVGSPVGTQLKDYLMPVTVENRAGWVVLMLAIVGVVEGKFHVGVWLRWAMRIVVVAFATYLLTHPAFRMAEEAHEFALAVANAIVLALGMLMLWSLASDRSDGHAADGATIGRLDVALLVGTTGSAAIVAGLSDSQKLAQYLGALAMAQTVLWGVQLFNHREARLNAAAGPMVVGAIWLTMTAHLYAGLTGLSALAIALAFALATSPTLIARIAHTQRARQALQIVLIALLLGSALTAAGLQFAHDWNDNEASEWGEEW